MRMQGWSLQGASPWSLPRCGRVHIYLNFLVGTHLMCMSVPSIQQPPCHLVRSLFVRVGALPDILFVCVLLCARVYVSFCSWQCGIISHHVFSQIRVRGKKDLAVPFAEEIWIPIWVPTLCKRAVLTIVHNDLKNDGLVAKCWDAVALYDMKFDSTVTKYWDNIIATAHIDFDAVPKYPSDPVTSAFMGLGRKTYDGNPFEYLHFYGADATVKVVSGEDVLSLYVCTSLRIVLFLLPVKISRYKSEII